MATTRQRTLILFEKAVEELTAVPCALRPYDYVELHEAATRCVDVDGCSPSQFSVQPIPCGKALLQVPSIRATHWWETCGSDWYGRDEMMAVMALAYISHHGRDEARILRLYSRNRADLSLLRFRLWLGTSCSIVDLRLALDRLDAAVDATFPDAQGGGKVEEAEYRGAAAVWGDTIARLCGAYHDLDPHRAAFRLTPVDAYAALVHAPAPFGMTKPESNTGFQRYAHFRAVVDRLKKERACSA